MLSDKRRNAVIVEAMCEEFAELKASYFTQATHKAVSRSQTATHEKKPQS
jgi:hypothetical protein